MNDAITNRAVELLRKVMTNRPKCYRCKIRPQTSWSFDAASDAVATCDDCKSIGGMLDNEEPVRLAAYEVFQEIDAFLNEL